jgi:hypothetical protein
MMCSPKPTFHRSWFYFTRMDLSVRARTPVSDRHDTNTLLWVAASLPNPLIRVVNGRTGGPARQR